ncbi:MAG: DMT family transporter [Bacteroidota bacterium]
MAHKPLPARTSDYMHLHAIVLIWGFTAIAGVLIHIPAMELVLIRTFLATIITALWLRIEKKSFALPRHEAIPLLLAGTLTSMHWLTFFIAARISNVSTCLVGLATCSLWTSLLAPLIEKRKFRITELLFGLVVASGLYIVFRSEMERSAGLLVGILSAIFAAVFSLLNGRFINKHPSRIISVWEMAGSTIFSIVSFVVWLLFFYTPESQAKAGLHFLPDWQDWGLILFLAGVCTVYAFAAAVELMKRFTVFAMNLTINLEPVYGIALAFLFFGESERMSPDFYVGTLIILLSVLGFPLAESISRKWRQRQVPELR